MPAQKIEVHGLRELRSALRNAEGRSPREIQQANKAAAEIVARVARRRFTRGPHQGGGNITPAADSVKAQATSGRGIIAFGGQRSPHAPPLNFGGTIPRHGTTSRTQVQGHEVIFATIASEQDHWLQEYEQALKRIGEHL